jgi:hypothetical protein
VAAGAVAVLSVGLQVALAQSDMARTGSGYLATLSKRDLLDFTAGGKKACSLFFDGKAGEIISRSQGRFGFGVFGSSHMILSLTLSIVEMIEV